MVQKECSPTIIKNSPPPPAGQPLKICSSFSLLEPRKLLNHFIEVIKLIGSFYELNGNLKDLLTDHSSKIEPKST